MEQTAAQPEPPTLPAWIRVLPRGRVELVDNRAPLEVDEESLVTIVEAFHARGVDLVIDYEHQSLQGQRAPAAGWIKELQARPDGLWARVEWTPQAQEHLQQKEYRYFSPVLRLDPETRKPVALLQVALTNVPAIKHLPALVARYGGEAEWAAATPAVPVAAFQGPGEEHLEQLKGLLGLAPEAAEAALWPRLREVFRDLALTLELPAAASASQLQGAVAALKAGAQRLSQVQEELDTLKERLAAEAAAQTVAAALQAGKVTPAQKDWALEYCRRDPEGFHTYVTLAPRLVPCGAELPGIKEEHQEMGDLSAEELGLCHSLLLSPQQYFRAKAQIQAGSTGFPACAGAG
jgi:phage I-like protein